MLLLYTTVNGGALRSDMSVTSESENCARELQADVLLSSEVHEWSIKNNLDQWSEPMKMISDIRSINVYAVLVRMGRKHVVSYRCD